MLAKGRGMTMSVTYRKDYSYSAPCPSWHKYKGTVEEDEVRVRHTLVTTCQREIEAQGSKPLTCNKLNTALT